MGVKQMQMYERYRGGPEDDGTAVYLIDELKYYERIDRSGRQFLIAGWFFDRNGTKRRPELFIDGKSIAENQTLDVECRIISRQDVCDMYGGTEPDIGFRILIGTNQRFEELGNELELWIVTENGTAGNPGCADRKEVLTLPLNADSMAAIRVENVHVMIDQFALNGSIIRMAGWGYLSGLYGEYRPLKVWAEKEKPSAAADGDNDQSAGTPEDAVIAKAEYMLRPDIISLFQSPEAAAKRSGTGEEDPENRQWGFFLLLNMEDVPRCVIRFGEEGCFAEKKMDLKELRREKREKKRRYRNKWEMMTKADPEQKADDRWYREHLPGEAYEALMAEGLKYKDVDYDIWIRRHLPSEKELEKQRRVKFSRNPKISIAVPAYRTPEKFLREMVDSVKNQTYPNWELCIADGSMDGSLTQILKSLSAEDPRIRFVTLEENGGISGNTNKALEIAAGEFLSLLDHDDVLTPDALYEVAKRINETDADCLYTDEDKVDFGLEDFFEPHFKPDFNPDMLHSCNYICHFFVVRRDVFERAGFFRPEYDGSQDFDFILRCTSEAKRVEHIRKMLYHWRSHAASTAMNPENKMYCYTAGRNAILSDLEKNGYQGAKVGNYTRLGYYEPFYPLPEKPVVSVFTRKESLPRLQAAEETGNLYENTEIVFLPEEGIRSENLAAMVQRAKGDFFLFLSGIFLEGSENWIERLLSNALRPEVGVIGGMVYNELGRISSSGKIVRENGSLLDLFKGLLKEEPGYAAHALMQQDVSAVSPRCFLISREIYEKSGGFPGASSEMEAAALLCKSVSNMEKLVVYTPFARVKEKESPVNEDIFIEALRTGKSDPHYNPGFDPEGEAFTLTL